MRALASITFLFAIAAIFYGAEENTIRFQDITQHSGLEFTTQNSPTPSKNQIETMVAGVGLIDYDQDGYPDIYLVNGAVIPSLQKASPLYSNRLFHNNRDRTFTDVTAKAGVAGTGYGMGVAIGDYDNDGYPDIFVANVTGNELFHNSGDGTFTDVTEHAGLKGAEYHGEKMWSTGGGWFDYNNDGRLDLFVVNYCVWKPGGDPYCSSPGGGRSYCDPRFYQPLHSTLYRNDGNGHFTDVSEETGIARSFGRGMSVSFADFDGDGYVDAFVANDSDANFLFHNIGGKRFEEIGIEAGVAYNDNGKALSGMGSDFRDVNNDGRPDIWFTAVERETFPLFLNMGKWFFSATTVSGLEGYTVGMSGWGNGIVDFDNDGWKDLFVARSNVLDNIADMHDGRSYPEPNSVFRNLGNGKFEDVSSGAGDVEEVAAHRGVAFGDLDNDGRMDAVVTVLGGKTKVLRNVSLNQNNWLVLRLVGTRSNRMGLGARIRVTTPDGKTHADKTQWNEATTSVGYASSSDSRVHFGLGSSQSVREIEIRWPSGIKQTLHDVQANKFLIVKEAPE
ncbi:MAG: CRTAC1 family protein [Acidobacteriota bacterium]|nr:CRTAC1 family protein [Acidobacteriota bacterium]